jgi:glycosyltransferase involved in cell wall biosynthesis
MKPTLFIAGHSDGAFAALHARVPIELALFGGPRLHGAPLRADPAAVPAQQIRQRDVVRLIASGNYGAVIVGTGGRIALPLAWFAARRHRVPFIFWAALWRTPRIAAHLAAAPLMRDIYRNAAAVVTYGEHVSAYVAARGAKRVFVAPQAVNNAFWSGATTRGRADERFSALFVGRPGREKGRSVLLQAWRRAALAEATLTLVGDERPTDQAGVAVVGRLEPVELRERYAAIDVLVVPSIATRRFIEPWGLVVNEAMNQGRAIIASDAVGAVAGGLVRDQHNGLVVPARDAAALSDALRALAADRARCRALGAAGRSDVVRYTYDAWAEGFVEALACCAAAPATLLA